MDADGRKTAGRRQAGGLRGSAWGIVAGRFGWKVDCLLFPSPFALSEVEGRKGGPFALLSGRLRQAQPERRWGGGHWPKADRSALWAALRAMEVVSLYRALF